MNRIEKGVDYFKMGYNCAQAVLLAFEDDLNLPQETLLKIGAGLGAGFARTRNLCGAVNGMGIVYGLLTNTTDKAKAYQEMQDLISDFTSIFKDINCGQLLKNVEVTPGFIPQERTDDYYKTRPCAKVVACCIGILEKRLINKD